MEQIRVLNFVGRMDCGGIETEIMNVYRSIDRRRVQFDFVCHCGKEGDYNSEIRAMGGRIYEMPALKSGSKVHYTRAFEYVKALRRFFSEHGEHSIIHGHMTNTASIYMPLAKKYGGAKVCIAHSHTVRRPGLMGAATKLLQLPLPLIADEYFACSKAAARWIFPQKDIESGKVKIVHNGIPVKDYAWSPETALAVRRELEIEDRFAVGCIAGFKPEKNQRFLVEAFAGLKKLRPDAVLVFAGEGESMAGVKARVRELGMESSVLFLGLRRDPQRLVQAFDVFALPSLFEGFPLVCAEAQAAGLRMVISDRVTRETDITGLCEYVPLKKELWAESLAAGGKQPRKDCSTAVIKAGYDISRTAKRLEEFYLEHG